MENQSVENDTHKEEGKKYISLKFKKPKPVVIASIVAALLIIVALLLARGLFVAATVNGAPISRWSVIKELEKQGGKEALDSMVNQKIVETELNKQNIVVPQEEVDAEIKKIEAQVVGQGGTLQAALAQQGLTEESLREQIMMQKKLEKILADKVVIAEADIDAYIKENKLTAPKGEKPEEFRTEIREQMRQQKFQEEAQKWVGELQSSAKIKYFVKY